MTEEDLKGFKVLYDVNPSGTPTLGSSDGIPSLDESIGLVQGVGVPLNLEPDGVSFSPDVKIFIPCPGQRDVRVLDIYFYDGMNWVLANDADDPDTVQPLAMGWMVGGSREDDNSTFPATIALRVLHFSGVQAGLSPSSTSPPTPTSSGGGGCFISTGGWK